MSGERVLVAMPSFGAAVNHETAMSLVNLAVHRPSTEFWVQCSSLLCQNRNAMWCAALNRRASERPFSHVLLLDADVAPVDDDWFEMLLRLMWRHDAPVLGAVVPIKNGDGLTSTARETADPWHPQPLGREELRGPPRTWTAPDLLLGGGLILVDFRQPWVESICFTIRDRVVKTPTGFVAEAAPEDWDFSRQVRALGAAIWATTEVRLHHWGPAWWSAV